MMHFTRAPGRVIPAHVRKRAHRHRLMCRAALLLLASVLLPLGAKAQTTASTEAVVPTPTPVSAPQPMRGPVTNLPMPRYVSLKTDQGNARRGPALSHRIDWVYNHRAMPLEVVAEFGHWRRVRDRDGAGGWVHYALLSGVRTVLVEQDMIAMRQQPHSDSRVVARAEAGAVARLGSCTPGWCRISAQGERGWVPKQALWGVKPGEIRD